MSAPFRVIALIAAYNEEDFIGEVIDDLITQGVSVYLIDNHSTDNTVREAKRFLEKGLIGIETFPKRAINEFDWTGLLRRKEELARTLPGSWFIHTDADEFRESPWAEATLAEAVARVDEAGYTAIDFGLFNFWPTREDGPLTDGVRKALRYCEPGAHNWADRQIKCWKNLGAPVDLVTSGGHDIHFEGRRVFPIRFALRHYPIRSNEHGQRKVFKERKPRYRAVERQCSWHIQYDSFQEGDDFTRDPGTLRLYRAEEVRIELAVRNRLVEQRDAELAQSRGELSETRDALTRSEAERGQRDVDARAVQSVLEDLRRIQEDEVQTRDEDLSRLRDELTRAKEALAQAQTERDHERHESHAARSALDELRRIQKEDSERQVSELSAAIGLAEETRRLAHEDWERQRQDAEKRLADLIESHQLQLADARAELVSVREAREQNAVDLLGARATIDALQRQRLDDAERHRGELDAQRKQLERRLRESYESHATAIEELKASHQRTLDEINNSHQGTLAEITDSHQFTIDELRRSSQDNLISLQDSLLATLERQRLQFTESGNQLVVELRAAHRAHLAQEESRHGAELAERDQTRDRELARLREVVAEQLAHKDGDIERFREALDGRTRDLRNLEEEVIRLQDELSRATSEITHLTEDLNRVFTSKSWRVSSLGRSAWRLFGKG